MKIGLIGLGIMGKPMAKNMLKAGYDLTVNDLNQAAVDEIVACGAKAATNNEIGETCDLVMTMVPNSPQVKAVMLGEDGVAAHMRPGTTFIDMSSINPVASKEIAAELAKKNITVNCVSPGTILTDLWMPEISGMELARSIRSGNLAPEARLIAVTADVENGNHFDVSCFDAVILKPVTFEKLKKLLQIKE